VKAEAVAMAEATAMAVAVMAVVTAAAAKAVAAAGACMGRLPPPLRILRWRRCPGPQSSRDPGSLAAGSR